jgi:hypothetical protein
MRFLAAVAIGWCALSAGGVAPDKQLQPPNSLRPKNAPLTVNVRHRHRAVLTCQPQAQRSDAPCVPTFEKRDATTSLRLDPIKARKLRNGADSREPVEIRVASDGTPEAGAVLVAPGAWDVVWPGLPARKRFSAEAGRAVSIELETATGRCERVVGQCFVRADPTSKTAELTVR